MKQDHSPFIPGKRVENAQHVVRIKKNVLVAEKGKKDSIDRSSESKVVD